MSSSEEDDNLLNSVDHSNVKNKKLSERLCDCTNITAGNVIFYVSCVRNNLCKA